MERYRPGSGLWMPGVGSTGGFVIWRHRPGLSVRAQPPCLEPLVWKRNLSIGTEPLGGQVVSARDMTSHIVCVLLRARAKGPFRAAYPTGPHFWVTAYPLGMRRHPRERSGTRPQHFLCPHCVLWDAMSPTGTLPQERSTMPVCPSPASLAAYQAQRRMLCPWASGRTWGGEL